MCLPAPVLLPDAEGSTPLLGELPLRLAERDGLSLGVPALREIPETLAALAPHDGDLPATVQELQHPGQLSSSERSGPRRSSSRRTYLRSPACSFRNSFAQRCDL